MWIFTKYGFFSPVCARMGDGKVGNPPDPNRIMVRARSKDHLTSLIKRFPEELGESDIHESTKSDYTCRIFVNKQTWVAVIVALAKETDYDNFKSKVLVHQGSTAYEHVLHKVWSIMYGYQHDAHAAHSAATPEPSSQTPVEFMKTRGISPAKKGESPDFVLALESTHTSGRGHPRTIKGYGFEANTTPIYIILMENGKLDRKTAKKANDEYTPQGVVGS